MDLTSVAQAFVSNGPLGLIILYLIYSRRQDKEDAKSEREDRARYDDRRLEADLKLAAGLTALAMRITGKPDV